MRVVAARVGAMAKAMAAGEVRAAEPVVRPLAQSEGSAVEAERWYSWRDRLWCSHWYSLRAATERAVAAAAAARTARATAARAGAARAGVANAVAAAAAARTRAAAAGAIR